MSILILNNDGTTETQSADDFFAHILDHSVPEPQPQPAARLTIELVPKSCWFANVRSKIGIQDWRRLQRIHFDQAGGVCEICGGKGRDHGHDRDIELHEEFSYCNGTQKLEKLVVLCPDCHSVKHIGFALAHGRIEQAAEHLMQINGWSEDKTVEYINNAFDVWSLRSKSRWSLDISLLSQFGITIKPRP